MKQAAILILLSVTIFQGNAQTRSGQGGKVTTVAKFKPPKMSTILGGYKDSVGLPVAEVLAVAGQPLTVVDINKQIYTVTFFQFLYKKAVVSETEDGRAVPATSIASQSFTGNALTSVWVDALKEQLKKGEELYFFDVIAKDKQGRVMYAPTLKIFVL